MSDERLRQDVADAVRKHYFWWPNHSSIGNEAHCQCGERPRDWSHWADHLADVLLSLPGIAIMDTEDGSEVLDQAARAIWREAQPMPWQELRFRKMARAALLAAAAAAEGERT